MPWACWGLRSRGFIQDKKVDKDLRAENPVVYEQVIQKPKGSVFGPFQAVDPAKVKALADEPKAEVTRIQDGAKRNVLMTTAIFPGVMLVCYLILVIYFRTKGGYKPKIIISEKEEALLMTGGAQGPADM